VQSQLAPYGRDPPSVFDGVLGNAAGSSEISTAQLRAALTDSSAIVLDARPYDEYAVSHIPGARAVPASLAGIRLGSWKSARAFKGIICDDLSLTRT
jgi:hypothetical protein